MTRKHKRKRYRVAEYIGRRFGALTVLAFVRYGDRGTTNRLFHCRCDCGCEGNYWSSTFYRRHPECTQCQRKRRGWAPNHPLRRYWYRVRRLVPAWRDFDLFASTVGDPRPGQTIIPADWTRPLSTENWRWGAITEAARQGAMKPVTVLGVTKCCSEWAEMCGISRERMRQRLAKHSVETAVLAYDAARQFFRDREAESGDKQATTKKKMR